MKAETVQTKELEGDFYHVAVTEVRKEKIASLSRLQRTLKIGYNRAARLLEAMQDEGIISDFDNRGVRTVANTPPTNR